jgi:protein TonB
VSRFDLIAFGLAIATHAGIAFGLSLQPPLSQTKPSVVEVDVRKRVPPPPAVIAPPRSEPPPPERKVIAKKMVAPPPEAAKPPPNAPPKETPKPAAPVFGLTETSTTEGDSSFAMPVGNTTMIDPAKSAPHTGTAATPLPAGPPAQPAYKPVSEVYIKQLPEHDAEACGKSIPYPSEAEQLGIEGDVKLSIALDEKGHVHDVQILSGLGHGLDQAALYAIKHKCRFTPAVGTDGKPAAFVIKPYVFHFEIPR